MNIPNIPPPKEPIGYAELNGQQVPVYLNDVWWNVLNELFLAFQENLSDEGLEMPSQGDDNFTTLNTAASTNRLLVKSSDGKLYFNKAGTFKEVQLV